MYVLHTTEVMAIFEIFLSILAKIWLPWQCPLHPCNQKYLLWIGRPRKPPVISNCILVISRRNAFICIYSNLVPKLVAVVTPLCPLCTGVTVTVTATAGVKKSLLGLLSITDEFHDSTNPISKPKSARMCCIQLKLWNFCDFFGLFWPQFGCHGNVP